ncbi:MAG: signal peptidase I [Lachnospiraceae bacterium]|nr:signal peptidase I [Lachnospiraceae bacterium]
MARRKNGLDFTRRRERQRINVPLIREIVVFAVEIGIAVLLGFVLVYFLGLRTTVIGRSMEPVLYASDEILIDRFRYHISEPKRDDVIVFLPNGNEKSHYYAKRVVGVPGDTLTIENGVLYINGESYDGNADFPYISDPGLCAESVRLGTDEYFVMGDNVGESEDSRYANIGNVSRDYIIGRAWYVSKSDHRKGFVR